MSEISSSVQASASEIQMDYMKLLVTQLQNQNPLDPMDNSDMASQLAQFSQLSQLEKMNSNLNSMNTSFADSLLRADRAYIESMIGRQINFYYENELISGFAKGVGINIATGEDVLLIDVGDTTFEVGAGGVIYATDPE